MSFKINYKQSFFGSFQFLSSSFESLVKDLDNADFNHLVEEFDSNVLGLVKEKGFYAYEYMRGFEKFKEQLSKKENFYSLTGKKIVIKSMGMFLRYGINLKWRKWKIIPTCT